MKTTITLVLMMLGLFATSVQAENIHCHTIEDCRKMKAEVEADLVLLLSNMTPELTGILKTGVTSLRRAKEICEDEGMRLPTARELALIAQGLGAEGISETRKDGNRLIRGTDSAGSPDDFYFSNSGYKRPAGDLGNWWFWSLSVHPDDSFNVFILNGFNGDIDTVNRSYDNFINAVRCVQTH